VVTRRWTGSRSLVAETRRIDPARNKNAMPIVARDFHFHLEYGTNILRFAQNDERRVAPRDFRRGNGPTDPHRSGAIAGMADPAYRAI
jgi:hypothetical protein